MEKIMSKSYNRYKTFLDDSDTSHLLSNEYKDLLLKTYQNLLKDTLEDYADAVSKHIPHHIGRGIESVEIKASLDLFEGKRPSETIITILLDFSENKHVLLGNTEAAKDTLRNFGHGVVYNGCLPVRDGYCSGWLIEKKELGGLKAVLSKTDINFKEMSCRDYVP